MTHQFSGSCFRISGTFDLEVGEDLVESLKILVRELDLGCLSVGLDPLRIRGSGNWDHLEAESAPVLVSYRRPESGHSRMGSNRAPKPEPFEVS